MRSLSVLVKPSSSLCNASCTYCFYEDVSVNRDIKSYGFMNKKEWQSLIDRTFMLNDLYDSVSFAFQGGEPLLSGIEYFREFVDYCNRNKNNMKVSYNIQTNGVLLNNEFCEFFSENNFLVGLSIDGYKENHDKFRSYKKSGSFDLVFSKVNLLRKYNIEFNILTVLTKNLAQNATYLFNFFKEHNFKHVQIIPCFSDNNKDTYDDEYSLTPELFSKFYTKFFDLWLDALKSGYYISDNLIDNIVNQYLMLFTDRCGIDGNCQTQLVIESDGSLYPCDFYVIDKYNLGNINNNTIENALFGDKALVFKKEKNTLPSPCHSCEFLSMCAGGCKRMRPTFVNDNYCGYKELLTRVHQNISNIQLYVSKIV